MSDLPNLLEGALSHPGLLLSIKYANVSTLVLVILDVVDTFSDEVALMWPSRFTVMKVIYFVNRYLPLFEIALSVIFLEPPSLEVCKGWWTTMTIIYLTGCFTSEGILLVRTLALWEFSRVVLGILIALAIATVAPCLVVIQQYFRTIQYPSNELLIKTGCIMSISDGNSVWIFGCIILSETTVVALTLLKACMTRAMIANHNLPCLLHTMYRDGTCFYAIILLVSIANLLCMTLAPKEASSLLQLFHLVVHSSLTSRVLLNLRAAAARSSGLSLSDFHRITAISLETPDLPSSLVWGDELGVDDWAEPGPEA
ncbi:hypothetical protein C8Q73DRAFT_518016 [Cubamyces lactineus]|nr:hypothetical protein C8Q73DRAFT_518016 [Cubamyces lactineus]